MTEQIDNLAAKRKRHNDWLKWKVRSQAKQIMALSDKLKTHEAHVRQIIKDYQAKCDETAAGYADDETETGQQLYWRADGASDAMDALLTLVASPPRQPDETEPSHLWPLAPFWTDDKPEGAGK